MKKNYIIQIIFISIFFVGLTTPLIFINRNEDAVSVIENKRLAAFPRLTFRNFIHKDTLIGIKKYFDDNIGFRQKLILKNIKYMYKIFGKLEVPNHFLGKNENLFYLSDGIIKTYQGVDFESVEQIKALADELNALSDNFDELGTKFIFCPIPNKEEVYPEFMPDGIRRIRDSSMLKTLAYYLKENAALHCINMYDVLSKKKISIGDSYSDFLYYKNIDCSHWNPYGAFWGYKAIVDEITTMSSDVICLSENDVGIASAIIKSPILYLQKYPEISDSFNMTDILYTYNYAFNGRSDNSVPNGFSLCNDKTNSYFHYENMKNENGKTLLVFGDSYIWTFLLPMLSESFSNVYFLANGVGNDVKLELFNLVNPDFTLLETVARMTYYDGLLSYVKDLHDVFSFETQYVSQFQGDSALEKLSSLPSNNKDPFLIFDNGTKSVSRLQDGFVLSGWAIDTNLDDSPLCVIAVVGRGAYLCNMVSRPDIAKSNERYLRCGFSLSLPKDCSFNGDECMYVISKDHTKSNRVAIEIKD